MKLLRILLIGLICVPLITMAASTAKFVAGTDYKVTNATPPAGVTIASNSVIEFFNPGCPACFHAEPAVENWLKTKPNNVNFSRIPLAFHDQWIIYSKAYYVAVGLGMAEKITPILFTLIHVQNMPLNTQAAMNQVFTSATADDSDDSDDDNSLTDDQITSAFNSLDIQAKLQQSKQMMQTYQVFEIPTFLVNGKCITNGSMAKSPQRMMQVVSYLLQSPDCKPAPVAPNPNTVNVHPAAAKS